MIAITILLCIFLLAWIYVGYYLVTRFGKLFGPHPDDPAETPGARSFGLAHIFAIYIGTFSLLIYFIMKTLETEREAYLRAQEDAAAKNMDAKIKGLIDVSEELRSKLYDLERWESLSQEANSHLDLRMQRYLLLENLNFI